MFKKNYVGSDPVISLRELREQVEQWIKLYGKDAVFSTDAGHNNVEICIDNKNHTMNNYSRTGI